MAHPERVLFVHAHPDDESIETGGTIATLIDRGAAVTVLTCTRGERGEIIPPDLKGALEFPARVADLRTGELSEAMTILGVTDHRYLGDTGASWGGAPAHRYLDSGMRWGPGGAEPTMDLDPHSLAGAELAEVAADIASVILDVRPDAIVSYDERGGYGHPDHLRAGQAALRAAEVYEIPYYAINRNGDLAVDVASVLERKRSALGAYRSQLTLEGDTMVFPGGQRQSVTTIERYSRAIPASDAPLPFSEQQPVAQFVAAVLGGVIGIALGALLTVYNQFTLALAGQNIWIGAIAGTVVVAAVLIGFRLAFGTRVVPAFAAVGVIVVVGLFALPSARGAQLVQQSGPGLLWEIAPILLAIVVLAWPQGRGLAPGKIGRQSVKGPQRS